jgi:DNA-binding HxlR family transcriptional regulator
MEELEIPIKEKKISKDNVENCPVTATMEVIGGKWKILIIYLISGNINRFGKMSMMLNGITKQMLSSQLRELEADGIISRTIFPEIPPRVEYYLTEKGNALLPIMAHLRNWGTEHIFTSKQK